MLRTDTTKRFIPFGMTFLMLLLMFGGLKAQSSYMACNNQVNVSLSEDCSVTITADMILEGEDNYDPPFNDLSSYVISIATQTGSGIAGTELYEPGLYIVTITETVSGYDNNCWGTLLVEDKLPPVFVDDPSTPINEACPCPVGNDNPDCTLKATCLDINEFLNDGGDILLPEWEDCSETYLGFHDEVVDAGPCYPTKIQRTYVVTDASGNKATSCVMEYSVDPIDLSNDIHDPVSPIELPCNYGYTTQEIFDHFYKEKLDELLPLATTQAEEDEAIALATYYGNHHAYPTLYGKALSTSICNIAVTKTDLVIPACDACPNIKKIIRTWRYVDWCNGEDHEFNQLIVNGDANGPTLHAYDFTASVDPWGCTGTFHMPVPQIYDACSYVVSYDVTGPYGSNITGDSDSGYYVTGAPYGVSTFYYNAYDCCGNSTSFPVNVTVSDGTPPVAVAHENIVVSLTTALNADGVAKLYATSVDNGSHDGCGPVHLEIRREVDVCAFIGNTTYDNDGHPDDDIDDPDNGEFVKFCCTDLDANGVDEDGDGIFDYALYKVWLRVWDDGDQDGVFGTQGDHYNESWSHVRLENKVPASILCPADVTVDCDVDIFDFNAVGSAIGNSACGTEDVGYEDEYADNSTCGHGVIYRKWFILSNPASYCIQQIKRLPPAPYDNIYITFPSDTLVDCTAELDGHIPYWQAPACNLLAYSVDRDTFLFEDGACLKILNHWTVIDWCTYEPNNATSMDGIWEHTQVIKVIDDEGPSLLDCSIPLMLEADDHGDSDGDGITCENNAVTLTQIGSDQGDCASDWLKWTVQIDLYSDWNYEYVFSSTGDPNGPFYLPHTSSGEEIQVTLPAGVPGSMQNHRVIWKVTDGCGNITSCEQFFMVVDKKAPTPYCVNVSTALMDDGEIELWACDFDLGSFDNCSDNEDLRFTFTDVNPDSDPLFNTTTGCSSMTFDCDDIIASAPVEVNVYVWDEKDNVDFCTVFLTLIDNNGVCGQTAGASRIGGHIKTESGEELTQFSVELMSAAPNYPQYDMTDDEGEFLFYNVPMYIDYTVSGGKTDDYLNGVSTLDLVLIQKHILDIQSLDNPYKLIAADANDDEKISAIDLIELRKLILGIYDELPRNDSWRYPIAGQYMDPEQPWPFVETISVDNLIDESMDNDFIGVKIGDVNGTVEFNLQGGSVESRSLNTLALSYQDVIANINTTSIPVILDQDISVNGMQFTIDYPGSTLARIEGGMMDVVEENFNHRSANKTTFSWNNAKAMNLTKGDVLFVLVFEGEFNGVLNLSNDLLKSEAYVGADLQTFDVSLNKVNADQVNALHQNTPNPFNTTTKIGYTLTNASDVTMKFYDVSGQLIKVYYTPADAGYNELLVEVKDLKATGVVYYQIESEGFTATRKMIVIE